MAWRVVHRRFREAVGQPGPILVIEPIRSEAIEPNLAEGGPDAGVDPSPILVDGLGTMGGLDLLQPPLQQLAKGRSTPVHLPGRGLGGKAPQGSLCGRRIPHEGFGDLTRAAGGRVDAGKDSELPAARTGRALPHRACTIGVSCAHSRRLQNEDRKLGHKAVENTKVQLEECESGRIGRSRKPLWSQGHRGFESHLLRSGCRLGTQAVVCGYRMALSRFTDDPTHCLRHRRTVLGRLQALR